MQAQALFLRGRAYQKMGLLDQAIRDYQTAHARSADGRMDAAIGYCFSLRRRHSQACVAYEAAIQRGFRTACVYNNLGYAWRHLGKFPEAVDGFDKAVSLDSSLQCAYWNRAAIAFTLRGRSVVPLNRAWRTSLRPLGWAL